MSDDEGTKKQTGYRLEYAASGRAKCSGPKPCSGTQIIKGELRMGTLLDYQGNKSFKWRHWGCTTARILSNFKNQFDNADELDGFDDLNDEDKDKVRTAWAEGHVAEEDIPASARKDDEEDEGKAKKTTKRKKATEGADEPEEDKPKKKRAPAKAKADDPDVDEEEKPKRKRAPAKKQAVVDDDDGEANEAELEEKPKRKRAPVKKAGGSEESAIKEKPAKKAAPKRGKAKPKANDEQSGEEIALPDDQEISGTEEEPDAAPAKPARGKKAGTSKPKKANSDDGSDPEAPQPKPTSKPKAKAPPKAKPASKAKGKGRGKKAAATDDESEAVELPKDEELSNTEGEYEDKGPVKPPAKRAGKLTSKTEVASVAVVDGDNGKPSASKEKSGPKSGSSKKVGKSKVVEEPIDELEEPEVVPASKAKKAREVAKATAVEGEAPPVSKPRKAKPKEAADIEPEPEAGTAGPTTKSGGRAPSRTKKGDTAITVEAKDAETADAKPKKAPASKARGKKADLPEALAEDTMEVDTEDAEAEAEVEAEEAAPSKRKPTGRAKPASKARGAKPRTSKSKEKPHSKEEIQDIEENE